MKTIVSFPVFVDEKGNRFIFPGYRDTSTGDTRTSWGYSLQICSALNVKQETEKFRVTLDENNNMNFPHVLADATAPGFAHGGSEVWIIGGPTFDEISDE